jgi:hypothetical protein
MDVLNVKKSVELRNRVYTLGPCSPHLSVVREILDFTSDSVILSKFGQPCYRGLYNMKYCPTFSCSPE